MSSPQNGSTNYCSANIIAHNQPSPISNLTITDRVDNEVKNDGYTQYFETPRKQNHCTPEINDTNTITTQVQPNLHPRLLERSHCTPEAPLKLTPSGKYYACFKLDRKTAQEAQCAKSRSLTNSIDSIHDIEPFDQRCVFVKG